MDENLHMIFYRETVKSAFEIAPNQMMKAVANQVIGFQMPGTTIPDFGTHAKTISKAGIYDVPLHAYEVVEPTLKEWNVWNREDLTGEGARARDDLGKFIKEGLNPLADGFIASWDRKGLQHPYLPKAKARSAE